MQTQTHLHPKILILFALFVGFFLISQQNFLLFHTLVELITIIIGCSIFVFTWNVKHQIDDHFFIWIGISFLAISGIDLLHTLTYKGMSIFPGNDANMPTQFWIAARFLQSAAFLSGFAFLKRKCNPNFMIIGFVTAATVLSVLIFSGNFPTCFDPEAGLTNFKKISEYVIALLFGLSIVLLVKNRALFEAKTYFWLILGLIFCIAAELTFTLYLNVYDLRNVVGHCFRLCAYFFIYTSIIEIGLRQPQELLYRQLVKKEEALQLALKESEQIATTDFLTNIYNRRFIEHTLDLEIKRALRYKRDLSLILLDLDDFKEINDTFGHAVGDAVLQQFAQWLSYHVRSIDIIARFGGDEFVILLPETNAATCSEILLRLKHSLYESSFLANGNEIQMTASVGSANLSDEINDSAGMFRKADYFLYLDKQQKHRQSANSISDNI